MRIQLDIQQVSNLLSNVYFTFPDKNLIYDLTLNFESHYHKSMLMWVMAIFPQALQLALIGLNCSEKYTKNSNNTNGNAQHSKINQILTKSVSSRK